MLLKLNESIISGKGHSMPGTVIETGEHGISDAEAEVLVRRGSAVPVIEDAVSVESVLVGTEVTAELPPADEPADGDDGDAQPVTKRKAKATKVD